ncbi:MAG: DUF11 domain-containing protein [Clostridia bacterium]|nr:DUF11 domain-containing protein [Clostridia bacterium]
MERKKVLNKILAIVCLITIALPSFSEVIATTQELLKNTTETAKFGISFLNKNGWGYKIQDRLTYRIYEDKNSTKDYSKDIYCLDYTKKFPSEDSNQTTFTTKGDLDDTITNKEKIKLIAENMYLTNMTDSEKDVILSEIFADLIERTSTDANPVTLEYIKKTLNEDDIFFAQQCAIWKYTNNLSWQGTSIWMTNKENPESTDWYQISNIGQARYEFMKEIYDYLTSDELTSKSNLTNPSLEKKTKTSTEVEDGYIVGPFYIKTGTNPNYTVSLTEQSGGILTSYSLVDKDGNRLSTKLENTVNTEFYVKVPLKTSATKVILKLEYTSTNTITKLWTNGESGTQPLIEVIKNPQTGSDTDEAPIEKPEKIYDLALRKYIIKVGEKEITDRTPSISFNKEDNEINYKHKKDPVVLKAGDTVVYNITVYNEGNQKATATRIKDYLPTGLEFVKNSEINKKYGWISSQDGSYIVTAYTKSYELDPFDQENGRISSITVQVECKVQENVTSGILTNVAEIAEDNIDDIDSEPNSMTITQEQLPDYKGKDSNKSELNDSDYFYRGQEDDDDFEKVTVEEPEVILDLALRKYISTVNGENQNREPVVDVSKLKDGTATTATYTHSKEPVQVKTGDIVIYSIRVYNEGENDAYANEITDYLPEGLGFLVNHKTNYTNNWKVVNTETPTTVKLNTIPNATKNLSTSDFQDIENLNDVDVVKGKVTIKTNKLQYGNTDNLIEAFNSSKTEPSSKVVQVACVVLDEAAVENSLRNIAAITAECDSTGAERKDRDSQPEEIKVNEYPNNSNIQDDDDYEKLILIEKNYDLALKKFLSAVNNEEITPSRLQNVNTIPLKNGETDAEYTMDKSIVKVKPESNVIYTIRVYNEGEIDTYVNEVKDNIPEGLEYIENSEINTTYRWKVENGKIVTDYLSEKVNPDKKLSAFNKETGEISYQEVKVEFKVVSEDAKVITNIAEITDDNGDDIDSTPNNNNPDEDDQDYDNIIPSVYDLALQKFITKLDDKDITSRIPLISTDENGKITYTHSKEPLTVVNKSIVVYTIRVYNEGTVEAYVEEIKDDIPEGLVYLPEHEINQKYEWKLYDEHGSEVENINDAKYIRTDYLSENKSKERNEDNQLKPYDKALGITDENPDYRDVQVAFRVDQSKMTSMDRIIKNIAEITDDNGDDIDSTPDNDNPDEDDIDDETIQLKYFDLSLLKYVTKVIVNEDGIIKETNTGHDGTENPEPAVKVELNRKKLDKTTVTFVYTIKVTNEGEIEGYAKEIKDRIPEGLEFYAEDNPGWTISEGGIVTTGALANTLLKPGESATVEIKLRWKRDQNNLGIKINTAEISKDENEYGTPDIDSTPDNNKDGEDDQDTAPVILSIITGSAPTYIVLTITVMTILATGIYSIKKYVL